MNIVKIINTAAGVFFGGIALLNATQCSHEGPDATDPPGGRSGLALYTDHETGVQYVGGALGGMTPRIDADGKVMVAKP